MSWVALATRRYDAVCAFYGTTLGCPVVDGWDRPSARATVFELNGMRLEVLDASRERAVALGDPKDRVHLVLEVANVDAFRSGIKGEVPEPHDTSWGARVLPLRDPDGIPVTVLAWTKGGTRPPAPTA
ncbi:MAG TPA: VOC family protein [Planctomycetota bacterium]|nr:VOC family protein [Planctomycetota bacterium]